MATLAYPYSVRDSANASTDNRKTGLTPTVSNGKTLAASPATVLAATVTIVEVGSGDYAALYDAEANGDASFPIDWGAALSNPNDRYGTLILTRDAGRLITALPAVAPASPGGLLTAGTGAGQVNPDGAGNVHADVVSIAGSTQAATNLHDDELAAPPAIPTATDNATAVWGATTRTLSAFGFLVTLADASVTSAKFSLATVNAAATGLLERLTLLFYRSFPPAGGSVTLPKSGNGNLVVKGAGGATISTQATSDDGTNQSLGAAS